MQTINPWVVLRKFASQSVLSVALAILLLGTPAKAQMWISGYYVDTTLNMSDIPWSKLTHAIHFQMHPLDGSGNIFGIPAGDADAFTSAAHASGVKALLCLGDSNGSTSNMRASISNNLNGFVSNLVNFINAHNYDGIDLDWEAGSYRTNPDQANYINLINALRSSLGPNKAVTMAVYWNNGLENVTQATYTKLDQVNIMCYDMDQWISWTFYNAANLPAPGDTQNSSCGAQAAQFAQYIPAAKIGLGIPFYGRVTSGCADSACSDGLHDPMQSWSGSPSLSAIRYASLITSSYWSSPHSWDSVRGASYISINQPGSANDRFISYTDSQQINALVQLAKSRGYGGVMEYEVEQDFMPSQSGDARHPLSAATYSAVFGTQAPPPVNSGPIVSSGSPTGALSAGTTQTTMSVVTNVKATCKYATAAGTAYSSMPFTFSTTGGTTHSTLLSSLTSGSTYNYYVRCSDTSGIADTTDYPISFSVAQPASAAPNPVSVTPSSGSGSSQAFTFQLTDAGGYSLISQINIMFDTVLGKTNSCYLEFWPGTKQLFLKSDDNATWYQTTLGNTTRLQNSQCSVNPAASTSSGSGTTLNVTLATSFASGFAGTKSTMVFAADPSGLNSGWKTLGSWTVSTSITPTAPTVTMTPSTGTGSSAMFAINTTDGGGYAAVSQVDLFVGNTMGATNTCYAEYAPATKMLYLKSDDNSTWYQAALGSSTVLQNSQCAINPVASSASGSGYTLTVNLAMTFTNAYSGTKSLLVFAADQSGPNTGWLTTGAWTVPWMASTQGPPTLTMTPSSGAGPSATFVMKITDGGGYAAVQRADLFIGNTIGATNSCWVEYTALTRTIALKSDDNATWSNAALGSSTTLQNSQCLVNVQAAALSGSGNTLTLSLPVDFTKFNRTRQMSVYAADNAGLNSGWQTVGTWSYR
jgi:GH18 family chitinase